jgi:phosphatidylglycerol---prolipoprotein diacylglyceryl transferase
MPLLAIPFPHIDPVIFEIGPIAVRWYALAYIAGILFAVWYAKRLVSTPRLWEPGKPPAEPSHIDDLLLWSTLGVILGGRLGYVVFYSPAYFLQNPAEILALWSGGMSFHGGFLGVVLACWIYARRHGIQPIRLIDVAACGVPVGLGLGRIANFINAELYGRTTDVPWAMVFPGGGPSRAIRASSMKPCWRGWSSSWCCGSPVIATVRWPARGCARESSPSAMRPRACWSSSPASRTPTSAIWPAAG